MVRSYRCIFLSLSLLFTPYLPAFAGSDWTQPTPEQLKMTSDPAAPGADAVYLFVEDKVDDEHHFESFYAQIKVLTEKGKEELSEIELPIYASGFVGRYLQATGSEAGIEGRTIEPDGTVVPFTGRPYEKEVVKLNGLTFKEKVFSLPDVQVGSILEYRWTFNYGQYSLNPPDWSVQRRFFVHKAHYHFTPTGFGLVNTHDALGQGGMAANLLYYKWLPKDAKTEVLRSGDGSLTSYDLTVENIPAIPDEAFLPPLSSFSYRVRFYYSPAGNEKEFWHQEGGAWSKLVNRFADPSGGIRAAVAQIVAPGDGDDQKLEKIYAAVMSVENTDFTREHSEAENRAEGLKTKTAADIWTDKRGSGEQITELFIAMARAAGLKAYAMAITDRSDAMMNPAILDWTQLTDEIAIVNVDGKDEYFDPGERDCEFGKLDWIHTQMLGIRQTDNGTEQATAPPGSYTDNETFRKATLTVAADGTVQGQIVVTMKGVEALRWRQRALRGDAEAANKDFEKAMQARVPDGVQVKMDGFDGLTDYTTNLVATLEVSGSMRTKTGKRVFLPASFFEANVKPPFAAQKRENPIDMRYPFAEQDQVAVTLGPGLKLENLPTGAAIPLAKGGAYKTVYSQTGDGYTAVRLLALGNTIFKQDDYSMLRTFFQSGAAQDQQQVVLDRQ